MPQPVYQLKADFFKALAHPTRVRIAELLAERDLTVGELLAALGVEASTLSQQLMVLRRAGLVIAFRNGKSMRYAVSTPLVAELLAVARTVITLMLSDQVAVLADLHKRDLLDRS